MTITNSKPFSIYIHIPFCRYKCPYCDFFVLANKTQSQHKEYVNYLLKEIEMFEHLSFAKDSTLQSIYFGGGTPSLIDTQLIKNILHALQKKFQFDHNNIEISLEANPEDISLTKAKAWKTMGINRVTLGIQSLVADELQFLGRQHQHTQALNAIDLLNQANLTNIGVDLIYQLPQQNLEVFKNTLDLLFTRSFTHLSLYGLTVEPKTPFAKQVKAKTWIPLAEEPCEQLFLLAKEYLLQKEFVQYEISNFALNGYESKHNQCYWQQQAYWGLGASAHSYLPKNTRSTAQRWWNPKNLNQYYHALDQNHYPYEQESLDAKQNLIEYIYTHLRTDGLSMEYLNQYLCTPHAYSAWQTLVKDLQTQHYLEQHSSRLVLNSQGQMRSDWICQEIIAVLI
ncbi:MAG TPA: radical SAM family heme chaperone HemW [Oligoflexia bacterium]|nr:radical SAM family heme chaperone HemW [Oligoflexia bacterium]HMR24471.1 radical SAM family heme chaperone HemW [Oligoflexia bacterium]